MTAYTWEQLGRATLRRQFPEVRGTGPDAVVETVRRLGPIQTQVARAAFLAVSSRLPGASYDAITAAYESLDLVRGSSLRGTVHTSAHEQHRTLDAVTRRTLEGLWRRTLRLERTEAADVQAEQERFGTGDWRTPAQLRANLEQWLARHESEESAAAARSQAGRFTAIGHSGLVRRPLTGGWDRQTAPGYRSAGELLGEERDGLDPDRALVDLVRIHLRAYGPASRADVAWWTGDGLRRVDAALAQLVQDDEVSVRPGPNGLDYYDLVDVPATGVGDPGVRLVGPYDGLLLGYHPKARDRFVDPEHVPHFWSLENGGCPPLVLAAGRLSGAWRLEGPPAGSTIAISMFPGTRPLAESDVEAAVAATAVGLGVTVDAVRITAG